MAAKPPPQEEDGSTLAWAGVGHHAHRDQPDEKTASLTGLRTPWRACSCDEGEALRPRWSACWELGCEPIDHRGKFHEPPEGSMYKQPPNDWEVRGL